MTADNPRAGKAISHAKPIGETPPPPIAPPMPEPPRTYLLREDKTDVEKNRVYDPPFRPVTVTPGPCKGGQNPDNTSDVRSAASRVTGEPQSAANDSVFIAIKLRPQPGDMIVVQTKFRPQAWQVDGIREAVKRQLPAGVDVLVIGPDLSVVTSRPSESQ